MIKVESTKANGNQTLVKGMAMRNTITITSMLAISPKEKPMGRGCTHGPMVSTTREIGKLDRSTGLASGKVLMERLM